jgi:hypothetical protein
MSSWQFLEIHGYTSLVVFVFVLPLSIVVISLGKRWDLWPVAHIGLGTTVVLLTIVSAAFAAVSRERHIDTVHGKLGTALYILLVIEALVGVFISVKWTPGRNKAPFRDRFHWWVGRLIPVISIGICFHGFFIAAWGIWAYAISVVMWFFWLLTYGTLAYMNETRWNNEPPR